MVTFCSEHKLEVAEAELIHFEYNTPMDSSLLDKITLKMSSTKLPMDTYDYFKHTSSMANWGPTAWANLHMASITPRVKNQHANIPDDILESISLELGTEKSIPTWNMRVNVGTSSQELVKQEKKFNQKRDNILQASKKNEEWRYRKGKR
jgi:hypothetical protein